MVDDDVEQVKKVIRSLLSEQARSYADVDRGRGWARGTTSNLLAGKRELRLHQLLSILEEISVDPLDFFHKVYGIAAGPAVSRAARHLDQVTGPHQRLALPASIGEADLRRLIREAVEQAVGSLRKD